MLVNLYDNRTGVPSQLQIGQASHEGGEGRIFFSADGRYVVKLYHPHRRSGEKRRLLEMITRLSQGRSQEDDAFLCWPLALVRDVEGTPVIGCVTRRIPTPPFLPLSHMNCSPGAALRWFRKEGLSWSHFLQVARGVARAVAVLHGRGCAHADLSNLNFLVNPAPVSCDVVLLDLDGLVVPGFLPAQVLGTMGIIAPEVLNRSTEAGEPSDRHSLAAQVLQTLLLRNPFQPLKTYEPMNIDIDEKMGWGTRAVFSEHPTDHRNRPRMLGVPLYKKGALSYKMLPPALQRLVERACVDGLFHPAERPTAREWIRALSWCLDELWQCPICRQHFPFPHWISALEARRCPFCGARVGSHAPSTLWVYEPTTRGHYTRSARCVVLERGWRLFADAVTPQCDPPLSRKGVGVIAHVEEDLNDQVNRLVNDSDTSWEVRDDGDAAIRRVGRSQSVGLRPGTIIRFGEDKRILVVKE